MQLQSDASFTKEEKLREQKRFLGTKVVSGFSTGVLNSLYYHSLFSFPLTSSEVVEWVSGVKTPFFAKTPTVCFRENLFFLDFNQDIIIKREMAQKAARKKLKLAKRAARVMAFIPFVKALLLTGSLAMGNSKEDDDIDFLVIVQKNTLWVVRPLLYLALFLGGLKTRRAKSKEEKDRLCINMWLDESALVWHKRNVYTAHEILQTKALLDRDNTYRKFISKNSWVFDFWPAKRPDFSKTKTSKVKIEWGFLEKLNNLLFKLQYWYMKGKITKEKVALKRAIFHPQDLSYEFGELLKTP